MPQWTILSSPDSVRYDACLAQNSFPPRVYSSRDYLDACTPFGWHCAVLGDYLAVAPLPIVKKWKLFSTYGNPSYFQQLGVFGTYESSDVYSLLHLLKQKGVREWKIQPEISLPKLSSTLVVPRTNLLLDLQSLPHFSTRCKRKIKRSNPEAYSLSSTSDKSQIDLWIAFKKKHAQFHFTSTAESQLRNLLHFGMSSELLEITEGRTADGELLGVQAFIKESDRATHIFSANSSEGFKLGGPTLSILHAIEHYTPQVKYLDFEGSDIPGVHFFYSGFGAINHPYQSINCSSL